MSSTIGRNRDFPIYNENGTSFYGLMLHNVTVDSVVMSLGDKITGEVFYRNNTLTVTMREYVLYNDVKYLLVNPPTIVREGMVSDNSQLNGMTKYTFEFYHPMYMLANFPFTDIAVTSSQERYLSQNKTFSWIGKPQDFIDKLNKNLEGTQWVVKKSARFPQEKDDELSEVISFDNNTIADAIKKGYETWNIPYVISQISSGDEYYDSGKRFLVEYGYPSSEIYESEEKRQLDEPFVFRFGKGVGLKNNSRTPRNNKIVTRLSGYGSENNIPYGYPQIVWTGNQDWDYTINNDGNNPNSYPIYKGIVGGTYVKLIKHPFTRTHLMPSIYTDTVNKKVNPNATGYDPTIEIKDYYDAVATQDYPFVNEINVNAPCYEIHEFDIKPELGEETIVGAVPINADMSDAQKWDDTMDDDGNYLQSYFKITLPQLSFDLYACAAITEEMHINMRSGACIGCTFPIQVDWEDYHKNFYDEDNNFLPYGEQRDYSKYPNSATGSITVIVQKEYSTFGTLMPNIYQQPKNGDVFVILGISLPTTYISNAEQRLDQEMMSYMLGNNLYYFDYPLKFDEHFFALHPNILEQVKPNNIVRFQYGNDELELFVKQFTVKYNNSPLPQYDITLTDNIEVVLNQIGQVADDVEQLGTLVATLRQTYSRNVWSEINGKLSKRVNDTAAGHITFRQGITAQQSSTTSGLDNTGDLTNTGNVIVGKDSPTHDDNPVSKSKNFNSGTAGWYLDNFGNMELESLTVRSFLEVTELLINRLQAQEGDTIFTDNDQITDVQRVVEHEGTQNETVSYILTLKEKWEGYFTAQQEGNIVKGIINTLAAEQANVWDETNPDHSIADYGLVWKAADPNKMPQNPSQFEYYEKSGSTEPYTYTRTADTTVVEGKTYWRKIQDTDAGGNKYYTSWMRIVEDRNTQGTTLGNNQIRVVLYGDQEVPSQKNFPPCVSMTIGRWGCTQDPDESGITDGERLSREQRQRLFYISVSDGKIMKLTGVDKPILRQYNYGTTLGTLPDFVKDWNIADSIIPGRDYLYAQGIVVGDFLQVDIEGKPRTNYVDCGEWVNGAELDEPTPRNGIYLKDEYNPIGQMVETHDVWHGGMKWRCLQHQPVIEGGVAHYYEPMWNSDYWQFIEGDANFYLELTSSNGLSFRRGAVNTIISAFLYFGNYDFDITNEVGAYYYNWTRHEQGNETLVYTAVSSTTGKNPMREGWFVKSGEQYLPTFDTTPQGGTTYYARSSSITYTPQDEAWNRSHEHMTSFNLTNLDMPQSWSSTNKIVFTCTVTILDGDNRIYVSNRLIS